MWKPNEKFRVVMMAEGAPDSSTTAAVPFGTALCLESMYFTVPIIDHHCSADSSGPKPLNCTSGSSSSRIPSEEFL